MARQRTRQSGALVRGSRAVSGRPPELQLRGPLDDEMDMWTYVLRHRILLRAIYKRSEAA